MTLAHLGSAAAPPGSQAATDLSIQGRAAEMRAAALVFEQHPVAGVGPSEFPLYYQQYAAAQGSGIVRTINYGPDRGAPDPRASHDMFLSVAAEVGILGLLVFTAIIATALGTLRSVARTAEPDLSALALGLFAALAGYVTAGLFLTLAYERYFWLLLALAGAAVSIARRRAA
jgi:O-antigen ligase